MQVKKQIFILNYLKKSQKCTKIKRFKIKNMVDFSGETI